MKMILKGAAVLGMALALAAPALAAEYPLIKPTEQRWSFSGPFGTYDRGQLQRGLKVYREACAACHGLEYVPFRTLQELGYSEAQVRTLAAEHQIVDGPDSAGDMFERPGVAADRFPSPYQNPEQAAASNNGAVPPDLSLMAKARAVERGFPTFVIDIFTQYAESGPDYLYSLLTGYQDPPGGVELQPGTYYNPHFMAGTALAMPPPFTDGQITYDDSAPETVDQYARDVAAFLMWTAEPHMETRKRMGFVVLIFLALFGGLVYLTKRKIWADTPH